MIQQLPPKMYIDTETCGLHSLAVLLQYAVEDGEITLYEIWQHPVHETLDLIEHICTYTVVGFNMAFDWFHLAKIYTIWKLCDPNWIPKDHIEEIAQLEPKGIDGPCIKPAATLDLLLHSRKGPYQALMSREDIRVKRVPTALAYALAQELEQRIEIDGIFFARSADKDAPKWKVYDITSKRGTVNPDFKDVVLKFNPSGGLKFLAEYAMGLKPKHYYSDVELDRSWRPYELGYAPYATAVASAPDWECYDTDGKLIGMAWPALIAEHINHWHTSVPAREYAADDIVYTRALYKHFGEPEPNDDDSVLACMVAVVRWHGFEYNREGIEVLLQAAIAKVASSPVNINKPQTVRRHIMTAMDDMEALIIEESTRKANLEQVSKWRIDEEEVCSKCDGDGENCLRCNGTGRLPIGNHPAAVLAQEILDVKASSKEIELYAKLLRAKRFHASFKVIGALSSRMSGGDGLNAQGIKKTDAVRSMFPLTWEGYNLCGGDFDAFEVTLADAVFDDAELRQTLLAGKSVHTLLGMEMYGKTYEEINASKGTDFDMYSRAKSGMFGFLYGGDFNTWNQKLAIPLEQAKKAYDKWCAKYPGIGNARMRIYDDFCSMRQPGGLGTQVVWHAPKDYCETFLGFRRYFTLENRVCEALFTLANKPPSAWRKCAIKVTRRDRVQTAGGALQSALFGAAFQIQAADMRAANNHLIQSPGAQITKAVQRKVWDLQPAGVGPLFIAPMNVHDEILCATHPTYVDSVAKVVQDAVEYFRPQVPLIGMKWCMDMNNWAEKKSGAKQVHITYQT
jgi:hypothetical protein